MTATAGCTTEPGKYEYIIRDMPAVTDPQFQRTMGSLLGPPIVNGNRTTTLHNGDEIFPAMLKAIAAAKKSVTFETFIYWRGTVGEMFSLALAERAKDGVRVHVLIDALGSADVDRQHLDQMRDAGVHVTLYRPLKWFNIGSVVKLNNRTHRKLLVIDGEVGFTGGVAIADEWLGHAQDETHWRDSHYCVQGPAVAHLQAAFVDNWMEATGEVLHGEAFFPPLEPAGTQSAQMFMSSSERGNDSMHLMYAMSIAAARQSIRIATACFVPDDLMVRLLLEARERGVRVQIIVPGPIIDVKIVRQASRARWGDLLKAEVEIYEYLPTVFHCKLLVIDEVWTSIGSSNLDNRSFRLNDEANLNIFDAEFAGEQVRWFDEDLKKCQRITYEMWTKRPLHDKVMESAASLLGPQL
jgi:cardiolipin synthase